MLVVRITKLTRLALALNLSFELFVYFAYPVPSAWRLAIELFVFYLRCLVKVRPLHTESIDVLLTTKLSLIVCRVWFS